MSFSSRSYISKMPSVVVDYCDPPHASFSTTMPPPAGAAPTYADLRHLVSAEFNNPTNRRMLTCYLPCEAREARDEESNDLSTTRIVSCVLNKCNGTIVFTTDINAAIIPSGAIIDSVEFFGYDTFVTKNDFSIGLGQLNCDISFPLIQNTTSTIANERVGGCRDFISCAQDGKNIKNVVLTNSHVNVELSSPVTSGGLQIVVHYHMKMI